MTTTADFATKPDSEPSDGVPAAGESETPRAETEERPLEDLSLLEDKTPDWFKTTYRVPLAAFVLGLVYLYFSYTPLYHTDLWGHLSYGRWIVQNGQLPETEPLLPLAAGQPFVDTAWLSKIVGYQLVESLDYAGLQFVNGLGVAAAFGLLCLWIVHRTGSPVWGVFAGVLFAMVGWEHLSVFRPQLVGVVFFVGLLTLLHSRPERWQLFAVPLGFLLWTNLHGSFLIGFGLIGAFVVGRAVDLLWRTRSWRSLWHDRRIRRDFVLLELAGVASLVNPWGLGLHLEALSFASHPNLAAIVEWEPMTIRMLQARLSLYVLAVVFLVHRFSPRRASATELLLLISLGMASMWVSRFIVWWGVVAAWSTALHASAVWNSQRGTLPVAKRLEAGGKWTVVAIGWLWIVFAVSPLGYQTIHGAQLDHRRQLGWHTPIDIADELEKRPPEGLVYSTLAWGDYLMWAGPAEMELFAASHAPVVPEEVWQDYLRISAGAGGWDHLLARYGVNTVVLAHGDRPELEAQLRNAQDEWGTDYEDYVGVIFKRKKPIRNVTTTRDPSPASSDESLTEIAAEEVEP